MYETHDKSRTEKKSKHITIISKLSRCYIHEIINNSYLAIINYIIFSCKYILIKPKFSHKH